MKKSIIVVLVLMSIAAILPIVGNSFMKSTINQRVSELESFGLRVEKQSSQSSYLLTQRHFEFLLQDSAAFLEYLHKYSDQQIPSYVNAILNGVLIGVDLEYSNLPFEKAIEVEIYPLSLSASMREDMKKEDPAFENYVEKFLESKSILYHIKYNLLNSKFKGYIKDIESSYSFDTELEVDVKLSGVKFSGEGDFIAPKELKSKIKSFSVDIRNQKEALNIHFMKLSSESKFDSKNSYKTDMKLKALGVLLSGTQSDGNITIKDLRISASLDDTKAKVQLESKIKFKELHLESKELFVNMKKYVFELQVENLDKNKFEIFHSLSSKKYIQKSLFQLIEKGLTINIKEFSLKDVEVAKIGNIKGFNIETKLIIQEDSQLSQKIAISPLMVIGDLEIHTKIRINKKMYSYIMQNPGALIELSPYIKEDGDSVIFKIDFVDSQVSINGQVLQ